MPLSRVPVQHKFGILSQGQAKSILRQTVAEESKRRRQQGKEKTRGPLFIDWNFVEKFAVSDGAERRALEAAGRRALQQLKYKLKHAQDMAFPSSPKKLSSLLQDPIDFSSVWYELVFLCQCEGSLQTDALLLLCSSLNCAPVSSAHIPCLLYITSLGYRWLKSDDLSEEFLKTGEVVLLRVLFLASLRLYCHILTGDMQRLLPAQEGEQFKADFDGFHMREDMYTNFPDAHFYWRTIFLVGEAMCHLVRGEEVPMWLTREGGPYFPPLLWHALDTWQSARQSRQQLMDSLEHFLTCTPLPHREQVVEGIMALGILAVAAEGSCEVLSVLQVAAHGVGKLNRMPSMSSLLGSKWHMSHQCGSALIKSEEAVVKGGVNILGHQMAFKEDESFVMASSSYLTEADDERSHSSKSPVSAAPSGSPLRHVGSSEGGRGVAGSSEGGRGMAGSSEGGRGVAGSSEGGRGVAGSGCKTESVSISPTGKGAGKGGGGVVRKHVVLGLEYGDLMSSIRDMSSAHNLDGNSKSVSRSLPSKYTASSMMSQYAVSEAPLEDGVTFLGSVAPSTVFRGSPSSTPNTLKDTMFDEENDAHLCHTFSDYPWELAVAFCFHCASIVTHGRLSKVQEQALQGCPLPAFPGQDQHKNGPVLLGGSRRVFGLSQLANYQGMSSLEEDASEDLVAWRVRFVAARGLSLVSSLWKSQTTKDGFTAVACDKLEELRNKEKDHRVLEGLRGGQVLSQCGESPDNSLAIYGVLAAHLVHAFLSDSAPLPPAGSSSSTSRCGTSGAGLTPQSGERPPVKGKSSCSKKAEKWKNPTPRSRVSSHWTQKPERPQTFGSRTAGALNAIAQEHWQRWLEAEVDKEADATRQLVLEDSYDSDMH